MLRLAYWLCALPAEKRRCVGDWYYDVRDPDPGIEFLYRNQSADIVSRHKVYASLPAG